MKLSSLILLLFLGQNLLGQSNESSTFDIAIKHTIYSKILKEEREFFVHVPQGFWGMDDSSIDYPICFILDGESQFLHGVSSIDFMSSAPLGNDLMPRTIVVGIPNTNRTRDLSPTKDSIGKDPGIIENSGGGPMFLDFITDELTPFIDSLYAINDHRTIVGHSLGGLLVFEALLSKSDFFNNYLAIDPALDFNNYKYLEHIYNVFESNDFSQENLFVASAYTIPSFLEAGKISSDNSKIVALSKSNLQFQKAIETKKWNINISHKLYTDENHFSVPYYAMTDGIKHFYSYYPFKLMLNYYHPSWKDRTDLVANLKEHYQLISSKLTYDVYPMESYLNSWANGLAYFERPDLALDLFDYNIELYPSYPSAYNSKAYFLLNQDKKTEAIMLFEKSLLLENQEDIIKLLVELKEESK